MRLKLLRLQHLLSQVSSNRKMFQKGFVLSKITGGQSSAAAERAEVVPRSWSARAAGFIGSPTNLTALAPLE